MMVQDPDDQRREASAPLIRRTDVGEIPYEAHTEVLVVPGRLWPVVDCGASGASAGETVHMGFEELCADLEHAGFRQQAACSDDPEGARRYGRRLRVLKRDVGYTTPSGHEDRWLRPYKEHCDVTLSSDEAIFEKTEAHWYSAVRAESSSDEPWEGTNSSVRLVGFEDACKDLVEQGFTPCGESKSGGVTTRRFVSIDRSEAEIAERREHYARNGSDAVLQQLEQAVGAAAKAAMAITEPERAMRWFEESASLGQQLLHAGGTDTWKSEFKESLWQFAHLKRSRGDRAGATTCFDQAIGIARSLNADWWVYYALTEVGRYEAEDGVPIAALARYEAALEFARRAGGLNCQIECLWPISRLREASDDLLGACRALKELILRTQALRLFQLDDGDESADERLREACDAYTELGRVLNMQGDTYEALYAWQSGLATARRIERLGTVAGATRHVVRLEMLCAGAEASLGEPYVGHVRLEEARPDIERLSISSDAGDLAVAATCWECHAGLLDRMRDADAASSARQRAATLRARPEGKGESAPSNSGSHARTIDALGGCEACRQASANLDAGMADPREALGSAKDAFNNGGHFFSFELFRCKACGTTWASGYYEWEDADTMLEEWGHQSRLQRALSAAEVSQIEAARGAHSIDVPRFFGVED